MSEERVIAQTKGERLMLLRRVRFVESKRETRFRMRLTHICNRIVGRTEQTRCLPELQSLLTILPNDKL